MDAEQARSFMLSLPHVLETVQWGVNLVFWVGDKHIGGKMFAIVDLEASAGVPVSFAAGAEHYHELLELDGLKPAPYLARIFWVAAERWSALRRSEWETELRHAHQLTLEKLAPKTRATLDLPAREQSRLISERKKVLAAQTAKRKR